MFAGIYEHVHHPGNYYLFIGLARDHRTDEEKIVYVPLRVQVEWQGTARMALRSPGDFERTFRYIGERLPECEHDWEEGPIYGPNEISENQRRCTICSKIEGIKE